MSFRVRNGTEPCTCGCHEKGVQMMHCMPCCNITYETFSKDGVIDIKQWQKLQDKAKEQSGS